MLGMFYKVKRLTVVTVNGPYYFENVEITIKRNSLDIKSKNERFSFRSDKVINYGYELEA